MNHTSQTQFRRGVRAALCAAGGLLLLLLGAGPGAAQETAITGESLVATNRGIVNFQALSAWEKRFPAGTRLPLAVPSPELLIEAPTAEELQLAAAELAAQPAAGMRLAAASPSPAASFSGISQSLTSYLPPDTQGAVGPNHIMTVLSDQVRISDRQGNPLSTVSLSTFWLTISRASLSVAVTCPRVAYDPYAERWILSCLGDEGSGSTAVMLAVSATSDPTGVWYVRTVYVDPSNYYYYNVYYLYGNYATADYISLGFNKQWIVVTANMLPLYGINRFYYNAYSGENLFVFDKMDAYTNGVGNYTILQYPGDYYYGGYTPWSMVPSVSYDESAPEMYLAEVDQMMGASSLSVAGTRLRLSKLVGETAHPMLLPGVAYPANGTAWGNQDPSTLGLGNQLGDLTTINLGDARIQGLVYRNGTLWCAHTVFLPSLAPLYSAVQWWQFTTNGALLQSGRVQDSSGVHSYAYPSLAVNHCSDMLVGYSGFSSNQYPSAYYSLRFGSDPTNQTQDPYLYKAGVAPYTGYYYYYGTNVITNYFYYTGNWGRYSATVVDPLNDLDLWTVQEYAETVQFGLGRWGTWWAGLDVASATQCGQVQFSARSYRVLKNDPAGMATITITNFTGQPGSVGFSTSDGTAVAGLDYDTRRGRVTFQPGQKSANFDVIIQDNGSTQGDRTVNLSLFAPTNFALGSVTGAVLTIVDEAFGKRAKIGGEFNFSTYVPTNYYWSSNNFFYSPYFVCSEMESTTYGCNLSPWDYSPDINWQNRNAMGALITVTRTGETKGRVMVDFSTAIGGSALPDVDYRSITNLTLVFDDYQMSTNVLIPITSYGLNYYYGLNAYNGPRTVRLALSNPRPAPEEETNAPGTLHPALGPGSESTLMIMPVFYSTIDAIMYTNGVYVPNYTNFGGFSFVHSNYRTDEYYDPTDPNRERSINVHVMKLGKGGTVRLHVTWGWGWSGGVFNYWYGKQAGSDDAVSGDRIYRNPVYTDPTLGTIVTHSDFDGFAVDLNFADNECLKNIPILIHQDKDIEFNEDIYCWLEQLDQNPMVNPYLDWTTVTILYHDAPSGALDREWNPDNISETDPAWNSAPGANGVVMALAVQPDGKTVLAGDFTAVNAHSEGQVRVARMDLDGSVDTTFSVGTGAERSVNALTLYPASSPHAGKILVAGSFNSFNGQALHGVARLLANGQLDPGFQPGSGVNGPVYGVALQADDKVIIVGGFSRVNDQPRGGVARLNADGSLDVGYTSTPGANGVVRGVALTSAFGVERAVIVGEFTTVNGLAALRVAQLNPDGTSDPNFDAGTVDGPVLAVAVQRNGGILIGGDFQNINNVSRIRIARLLPGGAMDPSFAPFYGANDSVYTIALQNNGKALIGGIFTAYNNTRRLGLARLRFDGTLDTSFLDTAYNQFAGLVNQFSYSPPNFLRAIAPVQLSSVAVATLTFATNGAGTTSALLSSNLLEGGWFEVTTMVNLNTVDTNATITTTVISVTNYVVIGGKFSWVGGNASYKSPLPNPYTVWTRADKRHRENVARLLGGWTPGPGNAEFDQDTYMVDEFADKGWVRMRRVDGRLGSLLGIAVTEPNTALPGKDYVAGTNANAWVEGTYSAWSVGTVGSVFWPISIFDDSLSQGNRQMGLKFLRAEGSLNLGGEFIPLGGALGRVQARMTIVDDDFPHGEFNFLYSNFITNEDATFSQITVIRTNGSAGLVSVNYYTQHAWTPFAATEYADYEPTSGRLDFADGQQTNSFLVRIYNDTIVEYDETVGLVLTNASGGAVLPGHEPISIATAIMTIVDDDFPPGRLNFSSEVFTNGERDGLAAITVSRTGGNRGLVSVDYRTLDGTATSPANYTATTGTLRWDANDSLPKTFYVPLFPDGVVNTNARSVKLEIFNPLVGFASSPQLLGQRTNATLYLTNADFYGQLAFSQPYYTVDEGGAATITIVRAGGSADTVSVDYLARPATAIPWMDFVPTNGTLVLGPGQISATFAVPLVEDLVNDGNKTVWLELSNPTNADLGPLTRVLMTIVDRQSFNEPAGSLDTFFSKDTQANGPVNALALQLDSTGVPDGRILVAGNFTAVDQVPRNRLARLLPTGVLDGGFDVGAGPNNIVRALAVQADSKVLIGGFFTQVASTNRNGVARLYPDGTVDVTFEPGSGANNPVYALQVLPDARILVGGSFSAFDSIERPGIVRLRSGGAVDTSFNAGTGSSGPVYAIALQSDGKIVLGGDFISFNGKDCGRIVRLFPDGAQDLSFDAGAGLNGAVWALEVQPDGSIVAAGDFTSVGGVACSRVARLKSDGTVDLGFLNAMADNNGVVQGANGIVFALKQQVDGRLVVAGDFTRFNGVARNRITRLNPDGSTDYSINFGSGANGFIGAMVLQPDRKIIIGGGFTSFDDQPRDRIARIHGGTMAGNGLLEFGAPVYHVEETDPSAQLTIKRRGGTEGTVGATVVTRNDTATDGIDYRGTNNLLISFGPGEVQQEIQIPLLIDTTMHSDRAFFVELRDYTGGATNGPQPGARVVIQSTRSVIGFALTNVSVGEGVASGTAVLMVNRYLATNTQVTVRFDTLPTGTAVNGVNYRATNGVLTFLPGETNKVIWVPIIDESTIEGNLTVNLALSQPSGFAQLDPRFGQCSLTIVDNDFGPGYLSFATNRFSVLESGSFVDVGILRTNGYSGVISLRYATADRTAVGGRDYVATNGLLTFAEGESNKFIRVVVLDDNLPNGNRTFTVAISNPSGNAVISGTAVADITVVDDESGPGSLNTAFDTGTGISANGIVKALAVLSDDKIIVGGAFTNFNGTTRSNLARLNLDGSLDLTFSNQPNALVTALRPMGKRVFAGGNFDRINGTNRSRIALLREDGSPEAGFVVTNINAAVYALGVQPDSKVVAGGGFSVPAHGVVRLMAGGAGDVSFVPGDGTSGNVYALELLNNGKIALGGEFTAAGGFDRSHVVVLNEDGSVDETFAPGVISNTPPAVAEVYALKAAAGGKLIIAGDFTSIGGVPQTNLARLNPDGTLDTTFGPVIPNRTIYALAVQPDGKLLIGGSFTTLNGGSYTRIARLNADGSIDAWFNAGRGADNTVYAVEVLSDGGILIGGSFASINGFPRRGVAVLRGGDPDQPRLIATNSQQVAFQLWSKSLFGMRYALQMSTDLVNWTTLQTNLATNVLMNWSDPGAGQGQRFYRAELLP